MPYEETKRKATHSLSLDHREKLSLTGVDEVESFDESSIALLTSAGFVTIRGSELHIEKLNLDGGELVVEGTVDSISYEDQTPRGGSFFSRLFRA